MSLLLPTPLPLMTTWTNKYNIDPAIAEAVKHDAYKLVGDISVTGLLRPPQMAYLERQNYGDLTDDVSDAMWRLLGSAIHNVIEKARVAGAIKEQLLTVEINGWKVSGHFDVYYPNDGFPVLKDYKSTSVWKYIHGRIDDWTAQLNCYRWMALQNGLETDKLAVAGICRDWRYGEAKQYDNYPTSPFFEMDIPMWTLADTEAFLVNRVQLHQRAREGVYNPCTEDERWASPTVWCVQKEGSKKPYRVFNSRYKAEQFKAQMKAQGYGVVERQGEQRRCQSFCPVMEFCDQAKELGVKSDDN